MLQYSDVEKIDSLWSAMQLSEKLLFCSGVSSLCYCNSVKTFCYVECAFDI